MIIEGLLDLIFGLMETLFGWVSLPELPAEVNEVISDMLDMMIQGVNFAALLFDFDFLKILIPIVLVIVNLERVWKLIIFIVKKIPFIDIS